MASEKRLRRPLSDADPSLTRAGGAREPFDSPPQGSGSQGKRFCAPRAASRLADSPACGGITASHRHEVDHFDVHKSRPTFGFPERAHETRVSRGTGAMPPWETDCGNRTFLVRPPCRLDETLLHRAVANERVLMRPFG